MEEASGGYGREAGPLAVAEEAEKQGRGRRRVRVVRRRGRGQQAARTAGCRDGGGHWRNAASRAAEWMKTKG